MGKISLQIPARKAGEQHAADLREIAELVSGGRTPRGALQEFLRRRGLGHSQVSARKLLAGLESEVQS